MRSPETEDRKGCALGPDWATMSDARLVEQARARDEAAFAALLERYRGMLCRACQGMVHDDDVVLEILQEVYLSTWRNLPRFEGRSQVSSWLYRIALNASLMYLRRRRSRLEISLADVSDVDMSDAKAASAMATTLRWPSPDEQLESSDLRCVLQLALDDLPDHLRQAFTLRYVDGLSCEQAARALGTTVPVVKTRAHRARQALRKNLRSIWLLHTQWESCETAAVIPCKGKASARVGKNSSKTPQDSAEALAADAMEAGDG